MQHLSTDALTALALGESDASAEHLTTCAHCRAEVSSLRVAADRFRAADVSPVEPPAAVWDRIAADIAALDEPVPAPIGQPAAPSTRASATRSPDVARHRRFSGRALIAACAASAVVAASLAVLLVTQLGGGPRSTDVAGAVLEPLGSSVAPARAEVIERDGQRLLVVDADALPTVDGYLDVWLLDADAQQMVSLGVMDAASTELALPADLDLAAFPVVDVSVEPYDGDPTHSGDSIWRGALEL
ncbi:anti-sigma factor [Agrococcus jenensis]|uniref:Anti-sigma-K factor rskA n=1 Tax=Agrococcus jenensis TaxID=46353 RepID=A0A3N2ATH7_9MICO|nr:anti-sigma factor [Agrococcus jenensis]ROR66310.1 anti-sigma-K factor rskA [Agrococcus jenensis]